MKRHAGKARFSSEISFGSGGKVAVDLLVQPGGSIVVLGPAPDDEQHSNGNMATILSLLGEAILRLSTENERISSFDGPAVILEKSLDEIGAGFIFIDQAGQVLARSQWLSSAMPEGKTLYDMLDPKSLSKLDFTRISRATIPISLNGNPQLCDVSLLPFSLAGSRIKWVALIRRHGVPASAQPASTAATGADEPALVGSSQVAQRMKTELTKAASIDSTVLLTGETGTGKSLAARWIHARGARRTGPFVAVNCSALPPSLIESELFGYEEGAFTGAKRGGKPGKFELANKGTILLDEVGDLPLEMQGKLLQVLDLGEIDRIGGREPKKVNARVIAATNKDLSAQVKAGAFRADLFFRLGVISIEIPALRDRLEDLPDLVAHFIEHLGQKTGRTALSISDEALALLQGYSWPGNIRELANAVEYAMVFCESDTIEPEHLPLRVSANNAIETRPVYSLEEAERREIAKCVASFGLSEEGKRKIAEALGVSRSTVYRKLNKYGFTAAPKASRRSHN
ncbi:MAG: sigma-54 interaction domain-containing protein [Bacillota bacterium]